MNKNNINQENAEKLTITLCSSAKFFKDLYNIKNELEIRKLTVLLPSMIDYHQLEETTLAKIQHGLIKDHFANIEKSECILVCNFDKNNTKGYIGGSCLIEMAKAFDKDVPIFLLNPVPEKCSYLEEVLAMQPIVINGDYDLLINFIKK